MTRHLFHPVLVLLVAVTLTLIAVHGLEDNVLTYGFDPLMLTVTILAYAMAVAVILVRTQLRLWTWLGAGMVATFSADAMLYLYLLLPRMTWEAPWQAHWAPVIRHTLWLETVRALLFVGGPMIIAGLVWEWKIDRETRRHRLERTERGRS